MYLKRITTGTIIALCAASVVAAQASSQDASKKEVSIAQAFRKVTPKVNAQTSLPILLPGKAPVQLGNQDRLYASGEGEKNSYDLEIGFVPNCRGSNACMLGSFLARKGRRSRTDKTGFTESFMLTKKIKGYFSPTSCGASCSPPAIQWVQQGVIYTIYYRGASTTSEKALLRRLARSAIAAGPRK